MKIELVTRYERHADLFRRTVAKRIVAEFSPGGLKIILDVDGSLGEESYRVNAVPGGFEVLGGDEPGLYFGMGKLLHSARWTQTDFYPKPTDGTVSPACAFRAIYFAVHFYNWYQNAPSGELEEYLEELMLWGYNTIVVIVPVVNSSSLKDPVFTDNAAKANKLLLLAKKLGMKKGLIVGPNQGFNTLPEELAADPSYDPLEKRGQSGKNVCLHKPGAADYMKKIYRGSFEAVKEAGLDYIITWPYDEGGCGCEKCRPWGANGYLYGASMIRECALEFFPKAKYIVSTWFFDTPDSGEYEGLYKRIREDLGWVDMIMTDDPFGSMPRYVLDHEPVRPVLNFPEISMWKLYPWGGLGVNPMPERFQGFWRGAKRVLGGGMPYSEGIYEDISKIQCLGYYWDPEADWRDILGEYANYEFGYEAIDAALEMMALMEKNHVTTGMREDPDPEWSKRLGELARETDGKLTPKRRRSWRWRLTYIRAILDEKRHAWFFSHNCRGESDLWILRYYSGALLADDAEAQKLFKELFDTYHCSRANGENRWTLPPTSGNSIMSSTVQ